MRTFAYTAYTPQGKRRRGVVVAEDESDASARVAALGLMPSTVEPQSGPVRARRRERRIDRDLLSVFTRQMAVLLGAGLTAEAALEAVQGAAGAARIERLAAEARAGLTEGEPLAEALGRAGGALPPWYAAAIRAGEQSGDLTAVFDTLADHLETSAGDRAAIASALVYPAFVTVVAVVVCAILMTTVAPQIVAMFQDSGRPLPPLTVAVMAIVDWVRDDWGLLLVLLALAVAGWIWVARTPALRDRRDGLFLRLPLIGRFLRMAEAAQYLRTMAVVINARLPLPEALRYSAGVLEIARYRRLADDAGEALRRGESLSQALARLPFLHPVARQLVQAGEASARLGPMTERAAVLAESWLRTERKRVSVIIEPASMVIVGAMVLTIVLAILLPIFDMQSLVTG
ncbi:MAG: type II secretion system F family protein [Rhodobacter sp.]|uniref:type II secretion system F family protein n=1 Tax=Pararhodobacter sp. TaxID=2127056 RepID=UPI002CF4AB59|nr:type II secretion system F family protein [Pararhodobacter sp.]MCC0072855.1 type II secretion system F family protein [Rhodobacter sp.]HPD92497.1 type II secretion system F family protein [Pararhodobacter sp.]